MLTESQAVAWERTRRKGHRRVVIEQFLVGFGIATLGPTLRAAMKGGWTAVQTYWGVADALPHIAFAIAVGVIMALLIGVVSWNRMERQYRDTIAARRTS